MTKEQEEAIKRVSKILELEVTPFNNSKSVLISKKDIETVLSMLKEKDKEIEKKDRQIKLMAQTILEDTSKLKTFWCNGCTQIANCPYKEAVDCIEDFFERKSEE